MNIPGPAPVRIQSPPTRSSLARSLLARARQGPVSVGRRIKWEQKLYWRNPAAAAFTFAFPLLFLVIFIAINSNAQVELAGGTVRFAQFYVPAIVAFGLISACYTNLAQVICGRRERGVLKRMRATPVSSGTYLAGVIGSSVIVGLVLTALTLGLGVLAYGVTFPGRYLGLVVMIAAGSFCFSALGVAISTFVPNEDAGPAIINFVIFPLLFISGTFGRIQPGSGLERLASIFPIQHLNTEAIAVMNPHAPGTGILATQVGILLLWGAIGIVVSVRRFRWEPRTHT